MTNQIKSSIILIDNILKKQKKISRQTYTAKLKSLGLPSSSTTVNGILKFAREELGTNISFRKGYGEIIEELSEPNYIEIIEQYKTLYFKNIVHKSILENQVYSEYISFGFNTINFNIEFIEPILNSIFQKRKIKIEYYPFYKEESSNYIANPIFLKEYLNRWYVIADSEKTPHQVFALDRILNIEVLTKTFKPKIHPKNSLYNDTIGVNFSGEPKKVVLWISKKQYDYLKTLPLHKSQKLERIANDGGYIISLNVVVNFELERWILYYGNHMKVIEPQSLRNTIANELKETLSYYEK